jgi:hypothetical protein
MDVLQGVCSMMSAKPDWASAKQVLVQTDFFNRLSEVHTRHISESVLLKIRDMSVDPKFDMKR